jgi:SOS-response transcriptional repressor LexA
MLKDIYSRIVQRLDATGLGAREACRMAGLHSDTLRNIERGMESGGRSAVSSRTLAALAPVLGTTSAWLMEGSTEGPDGAALDGGGATLCVVEWTEAGLFAAPDKPVPSDRNLGEQCGRWPSGYFATRIPDNAMNRLSPAGSYIVVDRGERSACEGLCYLALLDGVVMFRRWFAQPERAEPFSTDPAYKIEYLGPGRDWAIIGRVRRTLLDI